jgi:hypothetical protein
MPQIAFEELPDHARLWVFSAERALGPDEADQLLSQVDGFLAQWAAHGVPLTCARDWRFDQFLMVGVDEKAAGVSGCSIDALVRALKSLSGQLGVALVDNSPVLFRDGAAIRRVTRQEFSGLAESGTVGPSTAVFDNTVTTVADVRAGRWERPAGESWHAALISE